MILKQVVVQSNSYIKAIRTSKQFVDQSNT